MDLTIIGTSHISSQSIQEIKSFVQEHKPDVIAIELDEQRALSLLNDEKRKVSVMDIMKLGFKGYIFAKLGQYVQQKLGKMVGIAPGSEMKTALLLGRKNKLKVALIDQPIQITLKNFSRQLTWQEKFRFVEDLILGPFKNKKMMKELGLDQFDLKKVPAEKVIEKMTGQMKERYPNVYKTLVTDRNKYMVRKLVGLMRANPEKKILAVVGAGHKKGMEELLLKVDVIKGFIQ